MENVNEWWWRWPTATLTVDPFTQQIQDREGRLIEERRIKAPVVLRGRGAASSYRLTPHSAAWRTYGETTLASANADTEPAAAFDHAKLQAFVRRYGPLMPADDALPPFTGAYLDLAVHFRVLARAWSDDPERSTIEDGVARQIERAQGRWLRDYPLTQHLLGFLLQSALDHLEKRMPLRRCAACGSWIALSRSDRLYCDSGVQFFVTAVQRQREAAGKAEPAM